MLLLPPSGIVLLFIALITDVWHPPMWIPVLLNFRQRWIIVKVGLWEMSVNYIISPQIIKNKCVCVCLHVKGSLLSIFVQGKMRILTFLLFLHSIPFHVWMIVQSVDLYLCASSYWLCQLVLLEHFVGLLVCAHCSKSFICTYIYTIHM